SDEPVWQGVRPARNPIRRHRFGRRSQTAAYRPLCAARTRCPPTLALCDIIFQIMKLAVITLILAGTLAAAEGTGSWKSAGFLNLPAAAEVGAMSAVAVDRTHKYIYVLHRGGTP